MGIETIKTLTMAPGVTLEINVNTDVSEDSIDRYHMDTIWTGDPGVEPLYVPPHWHKHQTEHFTVLEGRIEATLDGRKKVVRAGDPDLIIPPRAVHSLQGFKGEKLVVRERTDPAGDSKALFFNDLLSTGSFSKLSDVPRTLRAFRDGDTYLALPLYFRVFDEVFIMIAGSVAQLFAPAKPTRL
ncbi:hypothetical protein SCUP515_00655 [Seiridium cupressi]